MPATAENVAPLRHAVVEFARQAGAGEDVQTDIALAVGEACANVVVHAYPPGDTGVLILHAEIEGAPPHLTVVVRDEGRGMTPRPDSPGLGLGLPLIANLSDQVEIHDGPENVGTELRMVFALQRPAD